MFPRPTLSTTGLALANTVGFGAEVLVYSPAGGDFSVDLSFTKRNLTAEWLNPATGDKIPAGKVPGGSDAQAFSPPFPGDAVLYLYDAVP
jgi:hypothetical protein